MANSEMTELEKVRQECHLTMRQISDLLEISELTIFRYCHGLVTPRPLYQKKLDLLLTVLRKKEAHDES